MPRWRNFGNLSLASGNSSIVQSMNASTLLGIGFACLAFHTSGAGEAPAFSEKHRTEIIADASRAISDFARLPERDGDKIPERFWGSAITGLKPLRVEYYHMHLKIVLAENARAEAGLMVWNPLSSYAFDRRDFAEFTPLSPDTDAFALFRYRIAKVEAP